MIESELFGHCKGAFTGAVGDRRGWLEVCGENGTVFLDEIGELEHSIQVKLLRVLQTQQFSRVGETKSRNFEGKFIAATNRELELEMQIARFREDLYYRLCADRIQTPTLREQLADRPEDLIQLTRFIAARLLRQVKEEVDALASEAVAWIEQNIGSDYAWPGNIRELEQCVRNVLIRKSYLPANRSMVNSVTVARSTKDAGSDEHFVKALLAGELTMDEVTQGYASHVYSQLGRYDLAANKLGVNWRTVRSKVRQYLSVANSPRQLVKATASSLGTETIDNIVCRWIEVAVSSTNEKAEDEHWEAARLLVDDNKYRETGKFEAKKGWLAFGNKQTVFELPEGRDLSGIIDQRLILSDSPNFRRFSVIDALSMLFDAEFIPALMMSSLRKEIAGGKKGLAPSRKKIPIPLGSTRNVQGELWESPEGVDVDYRIQRTPEIAFDFMAFS